MLNLATATDNYQAAPITKGAKDYDVVRRATIALFEGLAQPLRLVDDSGGLIFDWPVTSSSRQFHVNRVELSADLAAPLVAIALHGMGHVTSVAAEPASGTGLLSWRVSRNPM